MEGILEVIKTDTFLLVVTGGMILLLVGFLVLLFKFISLNKRYKEFMLKLGNGKNLEEDLETYMYRVNKVEKQNAEISNEITLIHKDLATCIQKIGMVRYNAFRDVGSDLSFALALLDEKNDGLVLNGIYARDTSNIYAKPVRNGKSTHAISEEEAQAIQNAISSK